MNKFILFIPFLLVFASCFSLKKNIQFATLYQQKPLMLKNKFKYKIINDPQTNESCYLRFRVNAGILSQKPNEQGLAHLIQHLAIKNSKSKEFLIKNKLSTQPDDIATTNNEDTVYSLDISCNEDSIKESLYFLKHIAFDLDFSSASIKEEIMAINEEEISDASQNEEISQKIVNKLYYGTSLANKSLLGSKENRKNFNLEQINNFYKNWYRADNMELLIVGNFDVKNIHKYIKEFFKNVSPKTALNRVELQKVTYKCPVFAINNPDINNEVEIIFTIQPALIVSEKFDVNTLKTREAFDLVMTMLNQKLNNYLKNKQANYSAEIWGKYHYDNFFEFYFSTKSLTNDINNHFKNDFNLIKSALTQGFSKEDFILAKNERKTSLENIINEEYNLNSYFIDLLFQDMQNERPLWKKEYYSYLNKLVDGITLLDCQNLLKTIFQSGNKFLFAVGDIQENEKSLVILKQILDNLNY